MHTHFYKVAKIFCAGLELLSYV